MDSLFGYTKLNASILYAILNMAAVAFIIVVRTMKSVQHFDPASRPCMAALHDILSDSYVVMMLVLIAHEGSLMGTLVWHGHYFDHDVQVVERSAWSCQPSMELHKMISSVYVGEYFMCAYSSWPLLLLCSILLLRNGDDDEAVAVTSGVLLVTMFVCIFIAVSFPVAGPRKSLAQLEPEALGVWCSHLALWLEDLKVGSSVSLPSQHTALAMSLWLSAIHYNTLLAGMLVLFIPGMVIGTIYGGLNYTLDVVIAVFIASITYSLGSQGVLWIHGKTLKRRDQWHGGGCCQLEHYDLSHDADLKRDGFKFATESDRLTSGEMFI